MSDAAFSAAVAKAGWVARSQGSDYGIDLEVEIAEDGSLTGLLFKVQLKATDERDLRRALSVRLEKGKREYYRALKLPVLMVRYHAPTTRLFVRWVHSHAPSIPGSPDSSSTLRMSEDDEWTEDKSSQLADEVRAFHALRGPGFSGPVRLEVSGSSGVAGVLSAAVSLLIRDRLAGPLSDIATMAEGGGIRGDILMRDDGFRVDLSGVFSSSMTYVDEGPTADQISADVLVFLGLTLCRLGFVHEAARLFAVAAVASTVIAEFEIADYVFSALLVDRRVSDLLRLIDALEEAGIETPGIAEWMLVGGIERLSSGEQDLVEAHFADRARPSTDIPERDLAAAHLNLASVYRARGKSADALEALQRATDLHPPYLKEGRIQSMLGGSFFLAGDYQAATEAYGRAIEMGEEEWVLAVYGDSLMMMGRYREGAEQIARYLEGAGGEVDPEWILKEAVLRVIVEHVGDEQTREPDRAHQLAGHVEDGITPAERKHRLDEAIQADALCDLAWFNIGVFHTEGEDRTSALPAFLAAALLGPHDVQAWINAIWSAISTENIDVAAMTVMVAHRHCGERLAQGIEEGLADDPDLRNLTLQMIADIVAASPEEVRPSTRLVGRDS